MGEENRGRGRPLGSKGKSTQFKSYQPKRWLPWMEAAVRLSISGLSNSEVAAFFDVTPQHVSNILCTAEAEKIRGERRDEVINSDKGFDARVAALREKAFQRMEKFIEMDSASQASPFMFVDRAMGIFKLTGAEMSPGGERDKEHSPGSSTVINGNVLIANPEIMDRIARGLEISNKVKEIHSGEPAEVVVGPRLVKVKESA